MVSTMLEAILIGVVSGVITTLVVLLTRIAFNKVRNLFPARAIFRGILGTKAPLLIFIQRLTDTEQQGSFLAPVPLYAVASSQLANEPHQLTPHVVSTSCVQSVAHVLNVIGRAGRTKSIRIAYADQDYDQWDQPMFIIGGSWKSRRAFENCSPYFSYQRGRGFLLEPEQEYFMPRSNDHDIGLLQKMINQSTGHPVWIAMGLRGAGTNAATYALSRWWKELGILYDKRPFGLLVELNDQDGWQQFVTIRMSPEVKWFKKLLHPIAWRRLKQSLVTDRQNIDGPPFEPMTTTATV